MAVITQIMESWELHQGPWPHFGRVNTNARFRDLQRGIGPARIGIDNCHFHLMIKNRHGEESPIMLGCRYQPDCMPESRHDMHASWQDPELSPAEITAAIQAKLPDDWDQPFDWDTWTSPDEYE